MIPVRSSTTSLDRTYEELKQNGVGNVSPSPSKFGSYLWGIETSSRAGNISAGLRLDRTYEELKPAYCTGAVIQHLCLDRTYEELKLSKDKAVSPILEGLDRTYEELKLRPGVQLVHGLPGLDRTYEELKLPPFCFLLLIASLFGSYLWGIETRIGMRKV